MNRFELDSAYLRTCLQTCASGTDCEEHLQEWPMEELGLDYQTLWQGDVHIESHGSLRLCYRDVLLDGKSYIYGAFVFEGEL